MRDAAVIVGGLPRSARCRSATGSSCVLRDEDIRTHGSGNVGASNVWRAYGRGYGIPVVLLDAAKGFVPALAGLLICGDTARHPRRRGGDARPLAPALPRLPARAARRSRRPAASSWPSRRSSRSCGPAIWARHLLRHCATRPSPRSSPRSHCRSCQRASASRGRRLSSQPSPGPAWSSSIGRTSDACGTAPSRASVGAGSRRVNRIEWRAVSARLAGSESLGA